MHEEQSLKLFIVLSRSFSTISEAVKKDIKHYGLSLSEFSAVELLYHKGPQTIQDIAKKVLLTSGSMTYVINQLEGKGFVLRSICPDDKRISYIEISEKGKLLFDEIFPIHEKFIAEMFSPLNIHDMESMSEKLKLISQKIIEKKEDKK